MTFFQHVIVGVKTGYNKVSRYVISFTQSSQILFQVSTVNYISYTHFLLTRGGA